MTMVTEVNAMNQKKKKKAKKKITNPARETEAVRTVSLHRRQANVSPPFA
jgi:hypothetical protein